MNTTTERRASAPPLRFDWRQTYIFEEGKPPRIVYVCQPSPSSALQVWRAGSSSWRWIVIDVTTRVVVRQSQAGSMGRAKLAAENNIDIPGNPSLWETVIEPTDPGDDVPF